MPSLAGLYGRFRRCETLVQPARFLDPTASTRGGKRHSSSSRLELQRHQEHAASGEGANLRRAVIAITLCFVQHKRDRHEAAERERGYYQPLLTQYAVELRPGMTRQQVEEYFQTNRKPFKQMCCVANFKGEKRSRTPREIWRSRPRTFT
jgi:hypothetical protein